MIEFILGLLAWACGSLLTVWLDSRYGIQGFFNQKDYDPEFSVVLGAAWPFWIFIGLGVGCGKALKQVAIRTRTRAEELEKKRQTLKEEAQIENDRAKQKTEYR